MANVVYLGSDHWLKSPVPRAPGIQNQSDDVWEVEGSLWDERIPAWGEEERWDNPRSRMEKFKSELADDERYSRVITRLASGIRGSQACSRCRK